MNPQDIEKRCHFYRKLKMLDREERLLKAVLSNLDFSSKWEWSIQRMKEIDPKFPFTYSGILTNNLIKNFISEFPTYEVSENFIRGMGIFNFFNKNITPLRHKNSEALQKEILLYQVQKALMDFFDQLIFINIKFNIVISHEIGFTQFLLSRNYSPKVFLPTGNMWDDGEMLMREYQTPILKKAVFMKVNSLTALSLLETINPILYKLLEVSENKTEWTYNNSGSLK